MTSKTKIITSAEQAAKFKYIIIGKSIHGRHVNAGLSNNSWSSAVYEYIKKANHMLSQLNHDTLKNVLIGNSIMANDFKLRDVINSGIDAEYVKQNANKQGLIIDIQQTIPKAFFIKQGLCNSSASQWAKNDPKYTHQISMLNDLNLDFTCRLDGFGSANLDGLQKEMQKFNSRHNGSISYIMLSRTDNEQHNKIIERLENTKDRIVDTEMDDFIMTNKTTLPSNNQETKNESLTNFNDLERTQGSNAVAKQLQHAIDNPNPLSSDAENNQQKGNTNLAVSGSLLVIAIFCLLSFSTIAYTKDLTQKHASGQSNRYPLAFFVSNDWSDSQSSHIVNTKHLIQYAIQDKTIIPMVSKSPNNYDGATLQNRIGESQICRAVACVTESEPHHPMTFRSVVITQKQRKEG